MKDFNVDVDTRTALLVLKKFFELLYAFHVFEGFFYLGKVEVDRSVFFEIKYLLGDLLVEVAVVSIFPLGFFGVGLSSLGPGFSLFVGNLSASGHGEGKEHLWQVGRRCL